MKERLERVDHLLRKALGPVPMPESLRADLDARLGAAVAGPPADDFRPAVAAAASFCILLGAFMGTGGWSFGEQVVVRVSDVVGAIERWVLSLSTLFAGG